MVPRIAPARRRWSALGGRWARIREPSRAAGGARGSVPGRRCSAEAWAL